MQTDTGFDFAAKSADFKGEELSTCWGWYLQWELDNKTRK